MVSFKKVIYLCLLLTSFLFVGCNSKVSKDQLPESKPRDFNFVFNYGVNSKNELDTSKSQFTKDMVTKPPVIINLNLTDEEMNTIYSEMKKINILGYPDKFTPKSDKEQKPFYTYSIKISVDGKEKTIYWEDENISDSKEAIQLRSLFKQIQEIVVNKDEYKKLPDSLEGYE